MSSVPMTTSGAATLPPRATAGPATPTPVASIDPVKLLNKHKWGLLAAAVIGGVIGLAAHFVLLRVYPVWRPVALLRCYPPRENVATTITIPNIEETKQFMATEARIMTSDAVLTRLSQNPQLVDQAPKWSGQFMETTGGITRFNSIKALEDLKDLVRARVIAQSSLIELSFSWRDKNDATSILRLLTDTYIKSLAEVSTSERREATDALRDRIGRLDTEITGLQAQRAEHITKSELGGSIQNRSESDQARLQLINQDLIEKTNGVTMIQQEIASMQERANSAAGDRYDDTMRQEAERDPQVIDARQRVHALETDKQSLLNRGIAPRHRSIIERDSQIAAAQQTLDSALRDALDRTFRARQDGLAMQERGLQEQVKQRQEEAAALQRRLTDISRIQAQIVDLDQRIQLALTERSEANSQLANLVAIGTMETARRVVVQQGAQVPNKLSFPKIELMGLAGTVLTLILAGGTMLVRELVDQRVKSPADIGIIPRTRLLGWIPDSAEDPEGQGATETAFRDRGRGVLAESYRQLRATLIKRIQAAGHRTIVIMSGNPGSGATTVASNLALAAAASDRRVLLIDANFRRPGVHRVFGLQEGPGLADVLAKQASLEASIQGTSSPTLDVLAVGSRDVRVVERLATDAMNDILGHARAAYDLVFIDVAPAVVAGDGVALANRCDASILVVRAFGEKRGMVARVKNELTDSRGEFLGVIVNAVRAATGGYLKGNIRTAAEYQRA